MTNDTIISVQGVNKTFKIGTQDVQVLKDVSMEVKRGDFAILIGPSGCGKSTVLHTILGLEPPTSGVVTVLGTELYRLGSEDERSEFRKEHVGMVYQQANWIKALTVVENVCFPLLLKGENQLSGTKKAIDGLAKMGMQSWAWFAPTELSSGQQQKVALVRALITDPELIIADEPTGNLDFTSGEELMNLLVEQNKLGKTILMVTHDLEYLKYCKSAIQMLDGKVVATFDEKHKKGLIYSVKSKRGLDL